MRNNQHAVIVPAYGNDFCESFLSSLSEKLTVFPACIRPVIRYPVLLYFFVMIRNQLSVKAAEVEFLELFQTDRFRFLIAGNDFRRVPGSFGG